MLRKFIQDFRMELWGFDAVLEDGTYAFAIFADTVILGTRHGINLARVFPPQGAGWGAVRRVGGGAIAGTAHPPGVAFGPSHFRREPDRAEAVLDLGARLSLAYRGPFVAHHADEPVWAQGDRCIRWSVPLLRAPVEVAFEAAGESWVKTGEGIHAYLFADFNPFLVPLRHLAVGHLQADEGTVFYAHARRRDGSTGLHVACFQGRKPHVVRVASGEVALAATGPYLDGPGLGLRPRAGRYVLTGSPMALIDGLPAWVRALANQITLGIEMTEWVGTARLDGPAGQLEGMLVHAQLRWP